jgi:coenzyme Q-binding protein COQ10
MYDLVADIERYPEFLPWCIAARNRKREDSADGEVVWSDLVVGFKLVRERFTSKVNLIPAKDGAPARIDVEYVEGPLKFLHNHWVFMPGADGGCDVDFYVEFEFRNKLFQKLIGSLFQEAVTRMVGAFEKRADRLYGPEKQR